jgi:hypothetical protein
MCDQATETQEFNLKLKTSILPVADAVQFLLSPNKDVMN